MPSKYIAMPIKCQHNANAMKICCQCDAIQMQMHGQSDANTMPTQCQRSASTMLRTQKQILHNTKNQYTGWPL